MKKPAVKKPAVKKSAVKKPAVKKAPAKTSAATEHPTGILALLPSLPPPAELHRTLVALTVLEAIAAQPHQAFKSFYGFKYHHFRYDHGNGDVLDAFFSAAGHMIRGFDHESPVSPYRTNRFLPGIYDRLPDTGPFGNWTFALHGEDSMEDQAGGDGAVATFAAWFVDGRWRAGRPRLPVFGPYESDGAAYLLGCLTPDIRFREQLKFDNGLVDRVMAHEALSDADLARLAPGVDVARARAVMTATGYGAGFPFGAR